MVYRNHRFPGSKSWRRSPFFWAALAALVFAGGAATGWMLLGSPQQRFDPDQIVYSQPVQLIHNQMHFSMMGSIPPTLTSGSSPKAVLPSTFHNFGRVKSGTVQQWSFVIANQGNTDLLISSGYTTCRCITAELSSASIPPGKAGLLTVSFDPSQTVSGAVVRRGVILETNDSMRPQVEIWVQASNE